MDRRSLLVLMWKHLMVRRRRFIHTFLDFFIPIMFFAVLCYYRKYIKDSPPPTSITKNLDFNVHIPDVQLLSGVVTPHRVLYSPQNKFTDILMDEVGKKLNLRRLPILPDHSRDQRRIKGYYGIESMTNMTNYLEEMFSNEAIVIFDNIIDEEVWPSELSYTVRMKNMFFPNLIEPASGLAKPHREYGEVYEEFLHLQWAIDTSYIKVVTNNDVPQTISLQEFPYYGLAKGNESAKTVCLLFSALSFIACFTPFVFLMSRLLEQRSTGIQELVKMVGVTSNTISLSHFLNVLPVALFYTTVVTVLLKKEPAPLVENTPASVIFVMMLLHHISVLTLSFACSYFTESTQYAVSISIFAYIATWMPCRLLSEVHRPTRPIVYMSGILPHVPLNWFWDEVGTLEEFDEGLTWDKAGVSHSITSGCLGLAIAMMLLQIAILSFIAWYMSIVRPGPYGIALPWNFIWSKDYWKKNEVTPQPPLELEEEQQFVREEKYFQEVPKQSQVGISVNQISKVFPKHRALTNVSLKVYKGEICVLLGHNGAGKTTLMSIITGMMSPTQGNVLVNGLDIRRDKDKIRKEIGFCPQHNLFFPDLTVLEHVMFFAMLKKGTYKEARTSGIALLEELGLNDKANTKSSALSGGMKRRLQLSCALAGGANVLVLDEPTAGLDVQTRRSLWDLLLSLRGSRTVLLSTHFMEEADALGDRVAALHNGFVRCYATSMHLKKAIGTGYRLSLSTSGPPLEADISAKVTAIIPDAALIQKMVNSLVYNLPSASSGMFPRLFTMLENNKTELSIESIGVGVSALEEVFLKLCSDTDINMTEDETDSRYTEPNYNKIIGIPLYLRIFVLLLKRQVKFNLSKKITFVLLQLLLPIVMITTFTATSNYDKVTIVDTNSTIGLDMYKSILEPKILYNVNSDGANIDVLKKEHPNVQFRSTEDDIAEGILRTGKQNIMDYNTYLAGIELNNTDAKILYTSLVRHAAPVAMNLLTNLIATQYMPDATGHIITTKNDPIMGAVSLGSTQHIIPPKDQETATTWALLIIFVSLASLVNLAALPCRELRRSSRHIHLMAGCPTLLHWGTTLVTHFVLAFTTIIIPLVLSLYFLDRDKTFDNSEFVSCVVVQVTLGILAFLSSMYVVSFWLAERGLGIFLVSSLILFGLLTPAIHAVFLFTGTNAVSMKWLFVNIISWLAPAHALTVGMAKTIHVARLNAYCELNRDNCPSLHVLENGFDSTVCCSGGLPRCYFCWDEYAGTPEMVHLVVQFIAYSILVILIQEGFICRLFERLLNSCYTPTQTTITDDMVRAEKVYVDKMTHLEPQTIEDSGIALLVHNVHKNFTKIYKSFAAVKGINFSVKKGECFGLLGVNGAGKSTTFRMLTGEECTTRGTIFGNGYHASRHRGKYLKTLGYCPQFFGLDDFQTGRDNLTLLLTCRGLDKKETENEVNMWLGVVGLGKFADRKTSGYSGGMSRRLGVAAAVGVGLQIALLDEPTAGVDVAARRRVWTALRRGTSIKRSVLLTSHSMDEMEALCHRIAIMAGGRICALGSAHELRAKHALGHAVLLKLKHAEHTDQVDGVMSAVIGLKNDFGSKFNCVIKDEHATMLHYHINETLHYSYLFTEIEALKEAHPDVLEDYSITETTLEEVFLSFAKAQDPDLIVDEPNTVV